MHPAASVKSTSVGKKVSETEAAALQVGQSKDIVVYFDTCQNASHFSSVD